MKQKVLFLLFGLLLLFGCNVGIEKDSDSSKLDEVNRITASSSAAGSGPVSEHGDLQVLNKGGLLGYTLCDESGNPYQLKGFSQLDLMAHDTEWIPGATIPNIVALTGSNAVRIAMYTSENGQGYMDNVDKGAYRARVKALIQDAIDADIYIMIDWHILNDGGYDTRPFEQDYWNESRAFFEDIASTYGSYDNVIFELCNEPKGVSFTGHIKPYAEHVLEGIRNYSDNLVIVGTPSWSSDVKSVIGNKITNNLGRGVLYARHFYAASHFSGDRQNTTEAIDAGIPVMLSEWGTVDYSGNGQPDFNSSDEWINWASERNLSWFNWSLSRRTETSAALKSDRSLAGPWTLDDFSDSGKYIVGKLGGGSNGIDHIEAETFSEQSGVQTQNCSEGGLNVSHIDEGDWIKFSNMEFPEAGEYEVRYRIASLTGDGRLSLDLNSGTIQLGELDMDYTGDWQSWKTISHIVTIPAAGTYAIGVFAMEGGWNINWLEFSKSGDYSLTLSPADKTTGSGTYTPNSTVNINYTGSEPFIRWEGDTGSVANVNSASTTVTMTGNINLTAVVGGSNYQLNLSPTSDTTGSGSYTPNSVVNISYNGPHTFIRWSGDTGSVADVNSSSTTVTMTGDINLTAEVEGGIEYITVTVPFTHEAPGEYYWKTTTTPTNINSWCTDLLEINGVDLTNVWKSGGELPPKQDGYYYIHFKGSLGWSHFEMQ